jgi:hypothetical protein
MWSGSGFYLLLFEPPEVREASPVDCHLQRDRELVSKSKNDSGFFSIKYQNLSLLTHTRSINMARLRLARIQILSNRIEEKTKVDEISGDWQIIRLGFHCQNLLSVTD